MNGYDRAMFEFVQKTTEAITVLSETNKSIKIAVEKMSDSQIEHKIEAKGQFAEVGVKLDGLRLLFLYVVVPLISGILAFVGIKLFFKLP
jgi:hypothetical protein